MGSKGDEIVVLVTQARKFLCQEVSKISADKVKDWLDVCCWMALLVSEWVYLKRNAWMARQRFRSSPCEFVRFQMPQSKNAYLRRL